MQNTPQIRYPAELPITARHDDILAAVKAHQVLIVAGETGSGKTTQLPKICLEAGLDLRGKIGCTQPRRVAALSISRRVAEELGVTWGREVGCKMRFNDDTARDTRIKFMTDGILLAEVQSDPRLRAYSALILDEAHERSLNIDFLLGHLQGLLKRRADLKLIITSATIDTGAFSEAFGGAPVIEVSGRLWPVEVRYAPVASAACEEDTGFIEAAVRATEDALIESDDGDVLVFMPTERDIRDTREMLETSLGSGVEVLGLFGRMPAAEQQRIFAPGSRRRVVVATNIAETSLTLPRIRYVIDTGLSRMSRYNPRTRTKRLPVEAISQSSANQRAGRAGRLRDGVCIRLYPEDDFEKRSRFTQPEIQRSNLAEVILRMKAFRLGEIETFPFLNPPPAPAIHAGYQLLHELGALDDEHRLTPLGQELARLPVDPTLGRMLLQARLEKALPEILVIAAGLSVPDPRERPDEEKEAAAAAHRAFVETESDFLTLLKIWRASPATGAKTSSNALRRFCKVNYLSHSRMREWRDIYRQLADAMAEERPRSAAAPAQEASYEAVHRCILAGQLGHIAQREERNLFKASGNRQVTVFPGSGLYERRDKPRKGLAKPEPSAPTRQAPWIVAGEIVQTSQLFARMIARIDPQWVIEVGSHLCKFRYNEPHWSAKAGRVLVWERTLIHGLELRKQQVDYGRINPVEATELFIRGALVAGEGQIAQRFFAENRKLRDKIETGLTRVRSRRVHDLDEALYTFYAERIEGVSSVHDLNKLVRSRIDREQDFLHATEADLLGGDGHDYDRSQFPDSVLLGNTALPVTYAYTPGHEQDGATLRVPLPVAEQLTASQLQWMVPGLREEQISVLLRALPKSVRRPLMPLEPKVRELAIDFQPGADDFLKTLAELITRKYSIPVSAKDWPAESLPLHLRPRIEIIDRRNKTVAVGRNLEAMQAQVKTEGGPSKEWDAVARRWERPAITSWSFGDVPESIFVEEVAGAPVLAYPGLSVREADVDLRVFRKREEAEKASRPGLRRLAELVLARDLAWLWKELRSLSTVTTPGAKKAGSIRDAFDNLKPSEPPSLKMGEGGSLESLQQAAYQHIIGYALVLEPVFPLTENRFKAMTESARRDLPMLTRRVCEHTRLALGLRQKILASVNRYAGIEHDLHRLLPPDFPDHIPHAQLSHFPRYLRAIEIRAERATLSPARDVEKAKQLAPFAGWMQKVAEERRDAFRWMLEEFRVSIFAQELGTAEPVSAQRLKTLGGF